jgi:hypothetical protein
MSTPQPTFTTGRTPDAVQVRFVIVVLRAVDRRAELAVTIPADCAGAVPGLAGDRA